MKVIIVEPGAFRTDWMGSSMTMHEPGPDYRDALALMHELRRTSNGTQPGDPARAARIIIDVVESPDPPRRLLLGSDAVDLHWPVAPNGRGGAAVGGSQSEAPTSLSKG